ncbi:hypothetical protein C3747_30g338 [Trypanosoma cruzi]|uniref:Uncharacterized protein n=1 Tax=Trypanosoma cruzi TaxID=5693 RepID=A0A2V2X3G5_TRYCR|nr:hypothetical protein C3747_30g338 [Trypanosoma cruzi]
MTFCTKGMGLSSDPHLRRMPWTAEKECVPGVVHGSEGKMVLDGARRVDVDRVDRASQVYPLEALRTAVATCEYNTFRERTFLIGFSGGIQCTQAMGLPPGVAGGDARRERHSHRHSFPSPLKHDAARANTPCGCFGWHALFCLPPLFPIPERRCRRPCRCKFLWLSDTSID